MTILGIGADVVYLPRILNILSRQKGDRFASRILSKEELAEWRALGTTTSTNSRARFLAVRWSVKESIYKAMYPIVRPTWKEVTYRGLSVSGNKPCIDYHPSSSESRGKIGKLHVSVSHDGDYVFTTVYIEEPEQK